MNVTDKLNLPSFIFGWILDHGWLQALLLMWLVTPGMYYVIAALFEKRLAPIWRYNYKTYVPGHVLLGVIMACSVFLTDEMPQDPDRWFRSAWWTGASILIAVVFAVIARLTHEDRTPDGLPDFNRDQAKSPTLFYYDFVVLPGVWFLVLKLCIPAFVAGPGIRTHVIAATSVVLYFSLTNEDPTTFHWKQWARVERAHPEYGLRFPWSKYSWVNDNRP